MDSQGSWLEAGQGGIASMGLGFRFKGLKGLSWRGGLPETRGADFVVCVARILVSWGT